MSRAKRLLTGVLGGGGGEITTTLAAGAITPTSTEHIVNGTFEAVDVSNFVGTGNIGVMERSSSQAHDGAYSLRMTSTAAYSGALTDITGALGLWCRQETWLYLVSGVNCRIRFNGSEKVVGSAGAWVSSVRSEPYTSAETLLRVLSNNGVNEFHIDGISLLVYDTSTLLARLGSIGRQTGTFVCHPAIEADHQCGLVFNYADDNNFILACVDRNTSRASLYKRIAGVWTRVTYGAITYAAGTELKVIVSGTSYSLYYGGDQAGSTVAISDSGLGTVVHGFSTSATGEVGAVSTFQ